MRENLTERGRNPLHHHQQHQPCIYQQFYPLSGVKAALHDFTQLSGTVSASGALRRSAAAEAEKTNSLWNGKQNTKNTGI